MPTEPTGPAWLRLTDVSQDQPEIGVVRPGRVLVRVGLTAALVIALVTAGSVVLAHRIAEREAVNAAAQATDLLAESVVQVAIEDSLLGPSPAPARARLDAVVKERVLGSSSVVRVKLWSAQGRIVYSDEPRLNGRQYALEPEERAVLLAPHTEADVTNLRRPENEFERGQGKLLQVYRPVWTPSGQPLLFETYTRYQTVSARTGQLWRGFAGLLVSSLLLLVVLLLPLLWNLLDRLRHGQRQREGLLLSAVDASTRERERIAATLHDGVVQELVGTSFTISAVGQRADSYGDPELSRQLQAAGQTVRTSIGGLRSLLVDIYPPSLRSAGLPVALGDLAAVARSSHTAVHLDLPTGGTLSGLDVAGEQLVFRVAQETLRNAAAHARASTISVRLSVEPARVVLEIDDDGVGFDPSSIESVAAPGHFGLRLLPELARQGGATLLLATAPGAGTHWRLEVPAA